jgi:ribosomal-protein-alanine N-acetyltransferase
VTVRIGRATRRDLPRLLEIEREVFPEDAYSREMFLDLLDGCGELFLVARVEGVLAGYIVTCAGKRKAELISIATAAEHRRTGIGRALLMRTLEKLRAANVRRLELMVRAGNDAAIAFYRGFGFRRTGRVRRYYEDGADALEMVLRLAAEKPVQTQRTRSRH